LTTSHTSKGLEHHLWFVTATKDYDCFLYFLRKTDGILFVVELHVAVAYRYNTNWNIATELFHKSNICTCMRQSHKTTLMGQVKWNFQLWVL
jgi:hypothetical protein